MTENTKIFMASTCIALLLSFGVFWILTLMALGNMQVIAGGVTALGVLVIVFAALPTVGLIYLAVRAMKSQMLPNWFMLSFGTISGLILAVGLYSTLFNIGTALWFGFPLFLCGTFLSLTLWAYPIKG